LQPFQFEIINKDANLMPLFRLVWDGPVKMTGGHEKIAAFRGPIAEQMALDGAYHLRNESCIYPP
jgi:hypothetical protein